MSSGTRVQDRDDSLSAKDVKRSEGEGSTPGVQWRSLTEWEGQPGGCRNAGNPTRIPGTSAGYRESSRILFQLSYPVKTGGGQARDYGPCDDEKDPSARGQLGGLLFHGKQTPGYVFSIGAEGARANAVCNLNANLGAGPCQVFCRRAPGMERKATFGRPSDVPTGIASVASQVYFR